MNRKVKEGNLISNTLEFSKVRRNTILQGCHYCFQHEKNWYRKKKIWGIALKYTFLLKSILRGKPRLKKCLVKCRDCGIYFLTDPRNISRKDLRCPFGCRQAHRRKESTMRSVGYYRTPEGKIKKKIQNEKRKKGTADTQKAQRITLDKTMFKYIRTLVSLLEGRKVSSDEIRAMLKRLLRQHSMVRKRKKRYFNQRGP